MINKRVEVVTLSKVNAGRSDVVGVTSESEYC